MTRRTTTLLVAGLLLVACAEDGAVLPPPTTAAPVTSVGVTTSTAPRTVDPSTTAIESTTTQPGTTRAPETSLAPPQGPLEARNGVYTIRWGQLAVDPGYELIVADPDNPFWFIHTDGERDGFAFSLELYTTGYGAEWEGQTGTFPIACSEPPPGANSTGICPHLDPDGPGPLPDLIGFAADGSVTIDRLDDRAFDITIDELTMAFGLSVRPFRMRGSAPS